jgi:RHS repeat-associated protein
LQSCGIKNRTIALQRHKNNYPFGSVNQNRSFACSAYRYGFNGKENDDEVKGGGNQQDYGLRIYDTRLARFLSVDPLTKKYPELMPYQFASNTPIRATDLDGAEANFNIGIIFNIHALIKRIKGERIKVITAEVTASVHDGVEAGGAVEINKDEKTVSMSGKVAFDVNTTDENSLPASMDANLGAKKDVQTGDFTINAEGSGTKGGINFTNEDGTIIPLPLEGGAAEIPKATDNTNDAVPKSTVEEAKQFMADVKENTPSTSSDDKQQKTLKKESFKSDFLNLKLTEKPKTKPIAK